MYIFIFEDGQVMKSEVLSEEDQQSSETGMLDIIDCDEMKQYSSGEWVDLAEVKNV